MAKVIKQFKDGDEGFKVYKVGDTYKGKREDYLIELGYLEKEIKKATKKQDDKNKEMWSHSKELDNKQEPKTKKGKINKK